MVRSPLQPSSSLASELTLAYLLTSQMEDSLLLLRFNCPSKQCDYIASGWQDLRVHVRVSHKSELWFVALLLLPLPSWTSVAPASSVSA